ncbi:MAG: hypothetical protein WD056_02640, partial [Gemmatimonadota bacterium]
MPTETGAPSTPRHHAVLEALATAPLLRELRARLPKGSDHLTIGGNVGSAGSALTAALHEANPGRIFVVVATDPEHAARIEADLESLLGTGAPHLFPQTETRFYSDEEGDPRIDGLRVEAVEALLGGSGRLFVTTPRALQERMAMPDRVARLRLALSVGEEIGFSLLVEEMEAMGYRRVPLVEEVGQFSVRGGLLDIFSLGLSDPVRIEFWGDEVTSIRLFDVTDQRSNTKLTTVQLLPASFRPSQGAGGPSVLRSFLEVLPTDTVLVGFEGAHWEEEFRKNWQQAEGIRSDREEGGESLAGPETLLLPAPAAADLVQGLPVLRITRERDHPLSLDASP